MTSNLLSIKKLKGTADFIYCIDITLSRSGHCPHQLQFCEIVMSEVVVLAVPQHAPPGPSVPRKYFINKLNEDLNITDNGLELDHVKLNE